jgi:membrane-bound lytic murein transglycosylase B
MKRFFVFFLCNIFFIPLVTANTQFADRPDVKLFIQEMVKQHHFREAALHALFNAVKIRPLIIKKTKFPFEKKPWPIYQRLFITEWRIRKGVEFWDRHEAVLRKVEKEYGVPASIIVATLGVETRYGSNTGQFKVIDALSNIAFSDSARARFFRYELQEFLLLAREQKLDPLKITGSYAGAMGQPQFMPSSYRHYAISFNHGNKIDLNHNQSDIIASIANFYKIHGWQTNQPIVMPASITRHRFSLQNNFTNQANQTLIKNKSYKMITLPSYWGDEYWFGFHNFDVIKRYNPNNLYAMAIVQLSNYISTLREKRKDV